MVMEDCLTACDPKSSSDDIPESIEAENSSSRLTADDLQGISHASIPRVVIVSDDNSNSVPMSQDGEDEPPTKRMYLEAVNQDGPTYVLTMHEESGIIQPTIITLENKCLDDSNCNPPENVNDVSQAWFTSKEDKSTLHSRGHVWKQGMWSKEEADLLDANIRSYCMEHGIVDAAEVIFEMTKDERKDFYRTVARGLNRPLFSVYRRIIRMYDNKNHVGKYTSNEIEKLKTLRIKFGNDWQRIGNHLGRSASSIKDKCRLMKDNCKTGKWFPEEENRLSEAVYDLSNSASGDIVTTGISWAAVAEKVGTRSEKQCRTKWLNYLNWKQAGGSLWSKDDDISLITKILSMDVTEETEVDWIELAKGWNSVRSPQWLRGKWWSLKRHVPGSAHLSFKDICQCLYIQNLERIHGEDALLQSSVNSPPMLQPEVGVLSTTAAISVPQVSVVLLPIPVKSDVGPVPVKLHSPSSPLQSFEVLPTGLQLTSTANPTSFFIAPAHTTCATLPYATCTSTATGQIIIQAATGSENVAVQMSLPSQILSTTSDGQSILHHDHDATDNLDLPEIIPKGSLAFTHGSAFLNSSELMSDPDTEKEKEDVAKLNDLHSETVHHHFNNQDTDRTSVATNTPQLIDDVIDLKLEHSNDSVSPHLVLSESDEMLASFNSSSPGECSGTCRKRSRLSAEEDMKRLKQEHMSVEEARLKMEIESMD